MRTRLTGLVGCRVPVVQTGMGWVSTPELTSATADAGGLGILAGVTLTTQELRRSIDIVRHATAAPFGVNIRADAPDLDQRVEICLDGGVPVLSLIGAPTAALVDRLHDANTPVVVTVGACRHAEKVVDRGVDAVIAQGREGGGHTGAVPTSLLVPQVVEAVGDEVPVIAAGGFRDGAGLVAALAWGADGIAMGTRFLLTSDSGVPNAVKAEYLSAGVDDTVVSRAIDGAPQRVIRTPVVDRLERANLVTRLPTAARATLEFALRMRVGPVALARTARSIRRDSGRPWSQVLLAANAPAMVRASLVEGRTNAGVLPTGQAVGLIDELPTVADVIGSIEADAHRTLHALGRFLE
ncbi:MAG: nitronate monooxygenase [Xanthomonadales bacterium]|nr:nitronate monooxygenase [Xanthomonadales bacterium]